MRRWKKKYEDEDDEVLTFDDLDGADDEDEEEIPRRRSYSPPRPIRTHYDFDESIEEDEDAGEKFDKIEPLIRSGKYKPKKSDPWNAHVLYNMLKEMGDI